MNGEQAKQIGVSQPLEIKPPKYVGNIGPMPVKNDSNTSDAVDIYESEESSMKPIMNGH